MKRTANILWLPGWYPSKTDFLAGDFTDRHAKATSKNVNVTVLFVTKDPALANNTSCIEVERVEGLTIYRGYYNCSASLGYFSKLVSVRLHFKLLFRLYRLAKKEQGRFELLHVHISLRQGLLAQWLKWKHKIPYVITEQSSWFMPVGDKIYPRSLALQKIISSNIQNADALHVVSNSLGNALKQKFHFIKNFTVIPNVVDTNIFYPVLQKAITAQLNFFTVTSDVYHKNTDGILRAFAIYLKAGHSAVLDVAGPNFEPLVPLAGQLGISKSVNFLGALPYHLVAQKMQSAAALIFFTRYETFGCVMAEALCCGTPVIATKIPVLEENLEDHHNALFVEPENEADLALKMEEFTLGKYQFNKEAIARQAAARYGYNKAGDAFLDFYKTVLPGL